MHGSLTLIVSKSVLFSTTHHGMSSVDAKEENKEAGNGQIYGVRPGREYYCESNTVMGNERDYLAKDQ